VRKAINENPQVQIAVIAAMGVAFAFIMFTMVLKKDPAPSSTEDASVTPAATAPAASAGAPVADPAAAGATDPATPSTPASPDVTPPPGAAAVPPEGKLDPSAGLPKPVVAAYEDGRAVAILIVDPKSSSDRQLESYEGRLESVDGVTVFVSGVKDLSRYSRIVSGVGLSRTPALVVVKPKSSSDGEPLATVSYGFRSPSSAVQALEDALYKGDPATYYPE
jgi:hypothetical protein